MRADFNIRAQTVVGITVGGFISVSASAAIAQSIQGTATYRERIALQPAAVFEAVLEDVTRAGAPVETIARTRMASPGNPPIAFTIAYDASKIAPDHRYFVRARIIVDDKPLFATDTATPVITRGSPLSVSLMLRRVGGGQPRRALEAADLWSGRIGRIRSARLTFSFREAVCQGRTAATASRVRIS